MIEIYHNPRCRKSRETLKIIQERSDDKIEIREYLKNPPSVEELSQIIKMLDITPVDLIRKGEKEYKDHIKGKEFTNDEIIALMTTHPKIIERPVVIKDKKHAVMGRPPENVNSIL